MGTTYLCGRSRVREHRTRGHEAGGVGAELGHVGAHSPRLVPLDSDVLAIDIGTVHLILRASRVLLPPEFDHRGFFSKRDTRPYSSKGAKRSEQVIKLEIGIVSGQVFDETWRGRGWGQGCRRIGWWVWREHDVRERIRSRKCFRLQTRESLFRCGFESESGRTPWREHTSIEELELDGAGEGRLGDISIDFQAELGTGLEDEGNLIIGNIWRDVGDI